MHATSAFLMSSTRATASSCDARALRWSGDRSSGHSCQTSVPKRAWGNQPPWAGGCPTMPGGARPPVKSLTLGVHHP